MKKIIVNGCKLVEGGMLIPAHIVPQLREMGVDIRTQPIGLGAQRDELIRGKAADVVVVDEFSNEDIIKTFAMPSELLSARPRLGVPSDLDTLPNLFQLRNHTE